MDSIQTVMQTGKLPATLIGAFFAARVAVTFVCTRWLGLNPEVGAGIQIALGVLLFLLLCFHSWALSTPSFWSVIDRPAIRWVLAFLAFSLFSFAWSGAVSPITSFAYWCSLAVDVATMLVLLKRPHFPIQAEALLRGYVYAACVLATLAWVIPVQDDLRLGDLDYFNTNQIGNLCALGFLFVQYLERIRTGRLPAAKIILLFTLIRSLSKTTLIAMIVCQAALIFRDDSVSRTRKLQTILCLLLACSLFAGLFAAYLDIYTTAGNQAETLTGRTAIWAYALEAAMAKPWFGNGFDALWHVMPPFGPDRFEARHAENELLQQFFAYGVSGIVLLAGIYGAVFVQVRRIRERPRRLILFALLIYALVRGLAEAEPFDLLLPLWSIVLFSAITPKAAGNSPSFTAPASNNASFYSPDAARPAGHSPSAIS